MSGPLGIPGDSPDESSIDELFHAYYSELRALARRALSRERRNHTLQPTELVHEAYTLLKNAASISINDRVHFIALASRVMRNHLTDYARKKKAKKNGGHLNRVSFHDDMGQAPDEFELVAMGDAMEILEKLDGRQAWVIDMRFIGGLTVEEVAGELGVSERTVKNDTRVGLAFLRREIITGAR
jgi:RNA polymerase sigma factor (TIGR02999 family)